MRTMLPKIIALLIVLLLISSVSAANVTLVKPTKTPVVKKTIIPVTAKTVVPIPIKVSTPTKVAPVKTIQPAVTVSTAVGHAKIVPIEESKKLKLKPTGTSSDERTAVDIADGAMTFTDIESGMTVNTGIKIDGEVLVPVAVTADGNDVKFDNGKAVEKGIVDKLIDIIPILPDTPTETASPTAEFTYTYLPGQVKETIILTEDAELSFPVLMPTDQKMIQWGTNDWKIVSATGKNTMVGIRVEQPYGIDAAGREVSMNYSWDGQELYLNYDREIRVINHARSIAMKKNSYDYYPIQYPLTIDPTWTSDSDRWKTFVEQGGVNYTVFMWNSTGTTEVTIPDTVDNIGYLIVGAGGSGGTGINSGGGGAGGLVYNPGTYITPGTHLSITVGNYLEWGQSEDSSIGLAVAEGGGGGGTDDGYSPAGGGSGGGGHADVSDYGYGGGTSGQGNNGGYGYVGNFGGGGGGGGKSTAGQAGTSSNGGQGGTGELNNITGINTRYAGGGGGMGYGGHGGYAGLGGGGTGESGGGVHDEVAATPNTGGGGAGTDSSTNHRGGTGVVFLRYETPTEGGGGSGSAPIADFTYITYEWGTKFYDTSTNGTPTSWAWIFGDEGLGSPPYNWSNASSYAQNPEHTYGALDNYTVYLNASNAYGSSIKYRELTGGAGAYVPSNVTMSGANPLYPQQIQFALVDKNGNSLSDVAVTVAMTSNSVANTNWLSEMFQISSAATAIDTTILSDTSDSTGTVVFPMVSSGRYHMTFSKPSAGISETKEVHPTQQQFIYVLATTATAVAADVADQITITLTATPHINEEENYVTLNIHYHDTGTTTNVIGYYLTFGNGTVVESVQDVFDAPDSLTYTYDVCNIKGDSYVWGVYGVSSQFGNVSKSQGITMKGVDTGGLASNLVKLGCNSWSCEDPKVSTCGIPEVPQ